MIRGSSLTDLSAYDDDKPEVIIPVKPSTPLIQPTVTDVVTPPIPCEVNSDTINHKTP
jgi:hypothetical protein